jgi:hypothetical protein
VRGLQRCSGKRGKEAAPESRRRASIGASSDNKRNGDATSAGGANTRSARDDDIATRHDVASNAKQIHSTSTPRPPVA